MSKTSAKIIYSGLTGSKGSWSVGVGTRGACSGGGPVRMFRSDTKNQHIQVLGGVGFGVKEDASTLCGGVSFRDTGAGPNPSDTTVSVLGAGNWDIDWEPSLWAGQPGAVLGWLHLIGACPADLESAGLSPVFVTSVATGRIGAMN